MIQRVAVQKDQEHARRGAPPSRRRSLFRKYALVLVALVSGALLTHSLIELAVSYQEIQTALGRLQAREAVAAADSIDHFLSGW